MVNASTVMHSSFSAVLQLIRTLSKRNDVWFDFIGGSCSILVNAELIGVICLKRCTCSSDRDNSSIYLFTTIGHEPHHGRKGPLILTNDAQSRAVCATPRGRGAEPRLT